MIGVRGIMGAAGRSTGPWSPLQYAPSLWLDASDSATITVEHIDRVTEWLDKSGNARHATAASGSTLRPKRVLAAINGRDVVSFADGTILPWMQLATVIDITTNMTLAFVFTRPLSSMPSCPIASAASNSIFSMFWYTDNLIYSALGGSMATHGSASTSTGTFLYSMTRDSSNVTVRRNGGAGNSQTAPTVTGGLKLIGSTGAGLGHRGVIAEIVVCTATRDVAKLEGYLAWKWGLVASLPGDHAYKYAPPA